MKANVQFDQALERPQSGRSIAAERTRRSDGPVCCFYTLLAVPACRGARETHLYHAQLFRHITQAGKRPPRRLTAGISTLSDSTVPSSSRCAVLGLDARRLQIDY